ncbi:Uncharacterised protein [Klebsiella pneumoniae]|nr:Uncharacterised protein [Klebsiella pneumoniae]
MEDRIGTTGAQFHIGVIDVRELAQIFSFDIRFCVIDGTGAAFHSNHFTVQILDILNIIVIGVDHDQ